MRPEAAWLDSLSLTSGWITFSLQLLLAGMLTLGVCAVTANPRRRLRIWGVYLFLAVAGWLYFCNSLTSSNPVQLPHLGVSRVEANALHPSLPVHSSLASPLYIIAGWAPRVYLVIVLILLIQLLSKSVRIGILLRSRQPPSAELEHFFQKICREMKIARCQIMLIPGLRSPATCGLWFARILLPAELESQLNTRELSTVIRHELIHVRQHDYLWDRLAALGCRLVFFHPAVWLAYRRIRWDRELACDQRVIETGRVRSLQYAECLTQLARWSYFSSRTFPDGIGFSSASSLLATRVTSLLNSPPSYSGLRRTVSVVFVVFLAAIGVGFLPALGLTLYQPSFLQSHQAYSIVRAKQAPLKRIAAPKQKTLNPEIRALSEHTNPNPPSGILFANAPLVLPVLETSANREVSASEVADRHDSVRPRTSGRILDESQSPMPGGHSVNWRKLALKAAIAGISAATAGDTDHDRRDRD